MDFSLGLSRAVAAAAVLALHKGSSGPEAGPAYPLAAGRILLQVSLVRKRRPSGADCSCYLAPGYAMPRVPRVRLLPGARVRRPLAARSRQAPAEVDCSSYLAQGYPVPQAPRVRLLASARPTSSPAPPTVARGFEHPLVRPARVLVASGLISFGIAALAGGTGAFGLRAALPAEQGPAALRGYQEPARWERQLLLADVSAPAPHSFRRGRVSQWNAHKNTVLINHANVFKPHSNVPLLAHANTTLVPHSNTTIIPHSNSDLKPHANTVIVPHANTAIKPHANTLIVPHSNTALKPHTNTALVAHANTVIKPHANTSINPHSNVTIKPHSNAALVPHTNVAVVPHVNTDTRPYK